MRSGMFPFLLPVAAIAAVVGVMIGLGTLFTVTGETATIWIGMAIIVGALALGVLLSRAKG